MTFVATPAGHELTFADLIRPEVMPRDIAAHRRAILEWIIEHKRGTGGGTPTMAMIADAFGLSRNGAHQSILALERAGDITVLRDGGYFHIRIPGEKYTVNND